MTDPDDLLLSDAERLHALTVLGDHFAAGRLDDSEFHARSGDVAAARTLGQLRGSFSDLPGGPPLQAVDGMIVYSTAAGGGELAGLSSSPAARAATPTDARHPALRDTDAELQDLRKRGKTVETMDGLVIGVTLVAFLILQFVVGWSYAWIVWPSLALTMGIPRAVMRLTDSDMKIYEKLKKADEKAREERLKAANERIRELGDGREKRD